MAARFRSLTRLLQGTACKKHRKKATNVGIHASKDENFKNKKYFGRIGEPHANLRHDLRPSGSLAARSSSGSLTDNGGTHSTSIELWSIGKLGDNEASDHCNANDMNVGISGVVSHVPVVLEVEHNCVLADFGSGTSRDSNEILEALGDWAIAHCQIPGNPTPSYCLSPVSEDRYVIGWVETAGRNGLSSVYKSDTDENLGGQLAMAAEACEDFACQDWPEYAIMQHEVSHLFSALDKGTAPWTSYGIMNDYWAWCGRQEYDDENAVRIRSYFA